MQQNCCEYKDACSSVIYQTVDVGLPIVLTPVVNIGKVKIMCCGEPCIELCQSGGVCKGMELKITQTVVYKIPIEYQVETNTGEAQFDCQKSKTACDPCHY